MKTKDQKELDKALRLYEQTLPLLSPAMETSIWLYAMEMKRRGGIIDEDIARCKTYLPDIMMRGNDLFYKHEGKTAERFDQIAEIIAVLSFAPGGITVFGHHFEN